MGSFAAFCCGVFLLYWPYIWCWYRKEEPAIYGIRWTTDRRALAVTLAVTIVVLAFLTVIALLWPLEHLPKQRTPRVVLELALSGLAAAIIEETFFRGWLQHILSKKIGVIASMVIVNILFAPTHLIVAPNWISLCTFFPGLIMSWLKQRYNSLLPPGLFHFLGNIWAIWFFPSPVKF